MRSCRIGAILIGGSLLFACASTRKKGPTLPSHSDQTLEIRTDTSNTFVPLHPPVVVPKSWREVIEQNEPQPER